MVPLDVYVEPKALRGFKRRAVAAFRKNKEYIEAIFLRRGLNAYHIDRFIKLKIDKHTEIEVVANQKQYDALKLQATEEGFEFASIHTHLSRCTSPSKCDLVEGFGEGEALVGICNIWEENDRIRTEIDFWQPHLPGKIKLIKAT